MPPAGSSPLVARLILLAAAAAVWSIGRDRLPPAAGVAAALATGFLGAPVVIDLWRRLAERLPREGRRRAVPIRVSPSVAPSRTHPSHTYDPAELPVFIPDLAVQPAVPSPRLARIADLHMYPLFYEKTPAHVHPAFAPFISRIDRIDHRHLHTFVTRTNGDAVGTGARFSAQEALQVSIYEAMERLFSTLYDPAALATSQIAPKRPQNDRLRR